MTRRRPPPVAVAALAAALAGSLALAGAGQARAQPRQAHEHAAPEAAQTRAGLSDAARVFLEENDAAMVRMMADMEVTPTGDIDRDFVEMMIPHHQGAIDMAKAVLRFSRNDQIRRLAQEIIVTQQQEIAAMRLAVGDPLPPSRPSPTQIAPRS